MRSFALALGLDESFFDAMMDFLGVTSRILHYPPHPAEGEVRDGLGAHTVGDQREYCTGIISYLNIKKRKAAHLLIIADRILSAALQKIGTFTYFSQLLGYRR